jgi:hypothetical protein
VQERAMREQEGTLDMRRQEPSTARQSQSAQTEPATARQSQSTQTTDAFSISKGDNTDDDLPELEKVPSEETFGVKKLSADEVKRIAEEFSGGDARKRRVIQSVLEQIPQALRTIYKHLQGSFEVSFPPIQQDIEATQEMLATAATNFAAFVSAHATNLVAVFLTIFISVRYQGVVERSRMKNLLEFILTQRILYYVMQVSYAMRHIPALANEVFRTFGGMFRASKR